jgi:hypothetical protein
MSNKIILKKSSVTGKIPTTADLAYGELAINYTDGKLYYKTDTNQINAFGPAGKATVALSGTPPAGAQFGDLWWNTEDANLYVLYNDVDSNQWVTATSSAPPPDLQQFDFVPKYNVQVETGDGTTDVFTLNNSVTSEQELLITVGGVPQTPGANFSYEASGTTLTFHEAPNPDDRIVIRYLIYRVR